MKLVVAILGSPQPPFPEMLASIRRTWAAKPFPDGVDVINYLPGATGKETSESNGDVYTPYRDNQILSKTVATFEHLLKTRDPDYIFRCCLGSYVDLIRAKEFLEDKPRSKFYCGIIGEFGVRFASGSGYFVSRDVASLIVENQRAMNHNCGTGDDVEVARLLTKRSIVVDGSARRCDVNDDDDIKLGHYHYHFRTQLDKFDKIHAIVNGSRF